MQLLYDANCMPPWPAAAAEPIRVYFESKSNLGCGMLRVRASRLTLNAGRSTPSDLFARHEDRIRCRPRPESDTDAFTFKCGMRMRANEFNPFRFCEFNWLRILYT